MLYQIFILFKVEIPFRDCKFPFQYISFAGAHDCPLDNPNLDLKREVPGTNKKPDPRTVVMRSEDKQF
jgi:hypothetical protein